MTISVFDTFFEKFIKTTRGSDLEPFQDELAASLESHFFSKRHGRKTEWDDALATLPELEPKHFDLGQDLIQIGENSDLTISTEDFKAKLKNFMPWRKGPYELFGTNINTEWRSDWKWQRIVPPISSLQDKQVLDIGCGNGYHLFRMLASGAKLALGIDPTLLFFYQFQLINRFLPDLPIHLLPLRGEHLPAFGSFDTVFSLGVLYHRRNPIDHLTELLGFLNSGGEVVLETLVVDGDANTVLVPEDRYAKMSNVWFLPSPDALEIWMSRAGFKHVRVVDINQTSIEEQRATEWMTFHSLADFLDPLDSNQTFEGYPAPKRALVIAQKP
jgi:tRNA (mo5U34)-methyltransferase